MSIMDTDFLLTCFEMHFKLAILYISCGINSPNSHYSCMKYFHADMASFLAVHVYNFCLCCQCGSEICMHGCFCGTYIMLNRICARDYSMN